MRNTLVCHHYGWTDIINTLSITNYLIPLYDKVYLLSHSPKGAFFRYYYRNQPTLEIHCFDTIHDDKALIYYFLANRDEHNIVDLHFFGFYDIDREDKYRNVFRSLGGGDSSLDNKAIVNGKLNEQYYFVRKFYEGYGIPYSVRVDSFFLERDREVEELFYTNFVKDTSYILIHDTPEVVIPFERNTSSVYYQLNQSSALFFDAVKVLENAKEIHLIDSVWAAVCYLLDAKYSLFKNIPIYVYCLRGHQLMFQQPVELSNWTLVNSSPRIIH